MNILNKKQNNTTVFTISRNFTYIYSIVIVLITILLVIPNDLNSQESVSFDENFRNKFGLKASNISGYGLFYNRKLSQNYYLQVNGLIYLLDYEEGDEDKSTTIYNYDFGLEFQRNIFYNENFRSYILAGAYYFYDVETNEINNSEEKEEIITNSYNIGIGVGVEYYFYKKMFFTVELGYKFYEDRIATLLDDTIVPIESPILERVTKVGASIGIGILFWFRF